MRNEFLKHYKFFINTFGIDSQLDMCIEEMSELIKEIVKLKRYQKFNPEKVDQTKQNIKEELADVINCVEELAYYYGDDEVEEIRKQKIERALKRYEDSKRG